MKLFITLFFISTSTMAATLGQLITKPEASSLQQYQITSGSVTYEKRSNFFDKKNDLRLGRFTSDYRLTDKEQKKINLTLTKIKEADEFLKKKDSSFNDLSTKKPHESFFVLDDYRVAKESDLYPELKNVYDSLSKQVWKQESGIKLSGDYKTLIHVKGGKEISSEPFNLPFHCQKSAPPTICKFKDYGVLYLPRL